MRDQESTWAIPHVNLRLSGINFILCSCCVPVCVSFVARIFQITLVHVPECRPLEESTLLGQSPLLCNSFRFVIVPGLGCIRVS